MDATEQNSGVALTEYLGVFRRRTGLILLPFAVFLILGTALAFLLPEEYEVETTMEVVDAEVLNQIYLSGDRSTWSPKVLLTGINQVIKRRSFLEDLVRKHGITEGYDVSDPNEVFNLYQDHILPNLKTSVTVQDKGGADYVRIGYTGRGARQVAGFVNDVRSKYVSYLIDAQREQVRSAVESLAEQRREAEKQAERATEDYENFELAHSDDLWMVEGNIVARKQTALERAQTEVDQVRLDLETLQRRLAAVKDQLEETDKFTVSEEEEVLNEAYERAVREHAQARTELDRLVNVEGKKEAHPAVRKAKALLRSLEAELESLPRTAPGSSTRTLNPTYQELQNRQNDLESEIPSKEKRVTQLEVRIRELSADVERVPELKSEEARLFEQRRVAQEMAAQFARQEMVGRNYLDRLNNDAGSFFRPLAVMTPEMADAADPVFPDVPLFVGASAFLGLMIGAGLAFVSEFLSASFVTVAQVRRTLPVPVLGGVGPIPSPEVERAARRKNLLVLLVVGLVVVLLVYTHVCFFVEDLRSNLPTWLFEAMQRFYGTD